MNAQEVIDKAHEFGLHLEPHLDKLAVMPRGKCPPEFIEVLKEHKQEVLQLLKAKAMIHLATQVLAGEFDDCDIKTCADLMMCLAICPTYICVPAIKHLRPIFRKLIGLK